MSKSTESPGATEAFLSDLREVIQEVEEMLQAKNRKYGDAALNPTRVFSRASSVEQIMVRLDDKISRIKNRQDDEDEDVIQDILGYLVLLRIAQKRSERESK